MSRNYKNKAVVKAATETGKKVSLLTRIRRAIHKAEHYALAKLMTLGHGTYYLLVAKEAHGSYRYAAGVLLVFLVLEVLSGNAEEGEG